jgi:hypothetical protein
MRYIECGSTYTQEYIRGVTYKICDELYIPRGMCDLYIPNRHEWGTYTLSMVFFLACIPRVCKMYVYIRRKLLAKMGGSYTPLQKLTRV